MHNKLVSRGTASWEGLLLNLVGKSAIINFKQEEHFQLQKFLSTFYYSILVEWNV